MVRKWLMLLGILLSTICAANFPVAHSYKTGIDQAKSEEKILLLMISQDGCPMCRFMKENTLKDANVSAYIRQNFIFAEVESVDETLPEKYESFVTPTFFFIDPKSGKQIGDALRGGFKKDAFLRILKRYKKEKDKQDD